MGRIKQGASIRGIQPEMAIAYTIADHVWKQHGAEDGAIMTESTAGEHMAGSLHYVGYGLDIRRWNLPNKQAVHDAVEDLREALGGEFDVVLHDTHVHVEFQPKNALNAK